MKHLVLFSSILLLVSACGENKPKPPKTIKQYSIEQFFETKRIGSGVWSEDEKRLLFQSDESGIFNLYEANIADGSTKALTHSTTESFFAVDYVPGTTGILYFADKGGDENDHLYLLQPDGSSRDLTPGAKEKASFMDWADDKTAFYYQSNLRDPRHFDVYRMTVGDWKSSLIYQNKDGYAVGPISRDGNYLALAKIKTNTDVQLFLCDLNNQQMSEISEAGKPASFDASGFSADQQSLFYTTDLDKEFSYLMRYDIPSGSKQQVYATNWDVMYSYQSENGKYLVIGVNEDGKSKVLVQDASGKEVAFPDIPDADVSSVNISPSEKRMRLTVGSSKSPTDLYSYDFETKALKRLTNALSAEMKDEDLAAAEVVRYKSFDGLEIPAIYYKPLTAAPDQKVPALVWVHGGPGGQSRVGYSALIQYLVNHGYAVLAVNNRGSSGYGRTFFKMDDRNHGDKDLQDCIYGKKYLQTLDYIDSERIGIIGGSYGGYMTMAALAFKPDEFEVGVNLFGVTNWIRTLRSIPAHWEAGRKGLYDELGDPNSADSLRLYDISPLFHAKNIKQPVMVLQGANDPRVLQVESDEIVAAVKENKVPVEYVIFPDEGHGFVKKENQIKGYGQVLQFLDKHLKAAPEIRQ